jgi:hypothetical protein
MDGGVDVPGKLAQILNAAPGRVPPAAAAEPTKVRIRSITIVNGQALDEENTLRFEQIAQGNKPDLHIAQVI